MYIETLTRPRGRIIAASPGCEFASELALEKLDENQFAGSIIGCWVMDKRDCARRADAGRAGARPLGANSAGTTSGSAIGAGFPGFRSRSEGCAGKIRGSFGHALVFDPAQRRDHPKCQARRSGLS